MGYCKSYRNYGGLKRIGILGSNRRTLRGRKKKIRRMSKASQNDGWQRKKAGGLAPAFHSSKKDFKEEYYA